MNYEITVQGGSSVRLPLKDKICDRDVIVHASVGGSVDNRALYQRVDYIESTTQCEIITDVIADNETGMELLATFPVLADRVPMGSRLDSEATRFYIPYPLSTTTIYYGYNNGSSNSVSPSANVKYLSQLNFLNNRCVITKEQDTGTAKLAKGLTEKLVTQTAPIGIFCYTRMYDDGIKANSTRDFIFFRARISQGAEIIRDYFPCYRKSDGEIGLYEMFTGEFLTNQGDGTFTKGNDVDW